MAKLLLKIYAALTCIGLLLFIVDPLAASYILWLSWPLLVIIIISLIWSSVNQNDNEESRSNNHFTFKEKLVFLIIIFIQVLGLFAAYAFSSFKFM